MKKFTITSLFFLLLSGTSLIAQERNSSEKFGKTLNLGIGVGYYGYLGHPVPAFHADFEFDVVRNFTLAPFITAYTYHNSYYWGNNNNPYRYYNYSQTIIPIGVKGTYYFDELFKANNKWDFYAAGSLGVAIVRSHWDNDYYGDRNIYRNSYSGTTPLFVDVHIGSEYHMSEKMGLFLDLSTGISTLGLAIHL